MAEKARYERKTQKHGIDLFTDKARPDCLLKQYHLQNGETNRQIINFRSEYSTNSLKA